MKVGTLVRLKGTIWCYWIRRIQHDGSYVLEDANGRVAYVDLTEKSIEEV